MTGVQTCALPISLYARRGICEVWIVDVQGGTIEVCRDPASDDYLERRVLGRGEVAEAAALAGVRVAVDDVVG